jgi:hypothetical protein
MPSALKVFFEGTDIVSLEIDTASPAIEAGNSGSETVIWIRSSNIDTVGDDIAGKNFTTAGGVRSTTTVTIAGVVTF